MPKDSRKRMARLYHNNRFETCELALQPRQFLFHLKFPPPPCLASLLFHDHRFLILKRNSGLCCLWNCIMCITDLSNPFRPSQTIIFYTLYSFLLSMWQTLHFHYYNNSVFKLDCYKDFFIYSKLIAPTSTILSLKNQWCVLHCDVNLSMWVV